MIYSILCSTVLFFLCCFKIISNFLGINFVRQFHNSQIIIIIFINIIIIIIKFQVSKRLCEHFSLILSHRLIHHNTSLHIINSSNHLFFKQMEHTRQLLLVLLVAAVLACSEAGVFTSNSKCGWFCKGKRSNQKAAAESASDARRSSSASDTSAADSASDDSAPAASSASSSSDYENSRHEQPLSADDLLETLQLEASPRQRAAHRPISYALSLTTPTAVLKTKKAHAWRTRTHVSSNSGSNSFSQRQQCLLSHSETWNLRASLLVRFTFLDSPFTFQRQIKFKLG